MNGGRGSDMTEDIRGPIKLPWPADREEGTVATKDQWVAMIRACTDEQFSYVLDHFLASSERASRCLAMSHDTLHAELRFAQETITNMYLKAGEYIAERVAAQLELERTDIRDRARIELLAEMERELDKSRP